MKIKATLTPEMVESINDLTVEGFASTRIRDLDRIKNFFINQWDFVPERFDADIKRYLIAICCMQEMFETFVQKEATN